VFGAWTGQASASDPTKGQAGASGPAASPQATCPPDGQCFADVPAGNPFYEFANRLYQQDIVTGYACGGANEPCDAESRPYYRPANTVTRQQMSKFVDQARSMPGINIETGTDTEPLRSSTSATNGTGVRGESSSGYGVLGTSGSASGVRGFSDSGYGVFGQSASSSGVRGLSSDDSGVYGNSTNGVGVQGFSASNYGVLGESTSASGVRGYSTSGYGVFGQSTSASGVRGLSSSGYGVYGNSTNGTGVFGTGNFGVSGESSTGNGVYGNSTSGRGMYGRSTSGTGVRGESTSGSGVTGFSDSSYGVYGFSTSSYAGYFVGDINVTGSCTGCAGPTKIDHPLDPENKYLYHSSVESPDMKNVYDGVVTLDANGEAEVVMPEWFEALNQEFRYQLTTIGGFAPVYIAEEISGNRFKIAGGSAGMKVSWQVTGIRHDPYAEAHQVSVEEDKPADERGKYLHPTEWGQPESKGIDYEEQRRMQAVMKP
jgi:hypothetical protein